MGTPLLPQVAEMAGVDLAKRRDYYGGPGSSGQLYVNTFSQWVSEGTESGVACVAMCEARHSLKTLRKQQKRWPKDERSRGKPRSLRVCEFPPIRVGEDEQQRQEVLHGPCRATVEPPPTRGLGAWSDAV